MTVTFEIAITSFHAGPFGGGISIGRDGDGVLRRAKVPADVLPRPPQEGESWRFTGVVVSDAQYGEQLAASVALPLLPQGKALIHYLATNPSIEGVGWGYAKRLWDALGADLYRAIAERDFGRLAEVVGPMLAGNIINGFGLLADEVRVFEWLDRYGVTARTAGAAARLWGASAAAKIETDPYVMTLLESWSAVDERALRLGLAPDDERRLLAAVEEAGARRWEAAHTASTRADLKAHVANLLGRRAAWAADRALDLAIEGGRLIETQPGIWQTRGPYCMERTVEESIAKRLAREAWAPAIDAVEAAIAEVERQEGLQLTPRQREAVHMVVSSSLSVIAGGAGTGKTTVVKAILAAGRTRGGDAFPQVALAGRAAKRIAEATGAPAMTIYRFLRGLETGKIRVNAGLLIIDESSMVDLPNVYRIMRALPPSVDIVFIGDPGQLPPIRPGIVFHRMAEADVPRVTLDRIHRQSARSGIPQVAADIRHGRWPDLPEFDPARPEAEGVFLARCAPSEAAEATLAVWEALVGPPPFTGDPTGLERLHGADVQVLGATQGGPAGTRTLSEEIEQRWMAHQPPIQNWGLSAGSKVLWIKNDYDRPTGLVDNDGHQIPKVIMNGTLGIVRAPTEHGAVVDFDDGEQDEIREADLVKVKRGWAISIHKSQGSAWRRVIIPVSKSRLLDRTLLYTAVTRARATAVLVGDEDLMRAAVEAPPTALRRMVAFTCPSIASI